jgi:rubrerythrin
MSKVLKCGKCGAYLFTNMLTDGKCPMCKQDPFLQNVKDIFGNEFGKIFGGQQ